MTKYKKIFSILLMVTGIALIAIGCASEPIEVTVPVEVTREVEVTRIVTQEVEVVVTPEPGEVMVEAPFVEMWASSAHAAVDTEPFRHWDEDDPPVVPVSCARCHTPTGYQDYLGVDGSTYEVVDVDHDPTQEGITCVACHNSATVSLTSVTMPSGVQITGLGDESRCMVCHQGRESKVSVDEFIAEVGVGDDEVSEELGFRNIHYYAAAATKYGTVAQGGYQYEGKSYDGFFAHVDGYTNCIGCHDPHTLQLKIDECQACHLDVETVEDLKDVRMPGSFVDYDGDGDGREGVFYELEGVREVLYSALQAYAADVAGTPVVYDSHSYPYFFTDTDGNGAVDEGEAAFPNRYATWTPRLLKAAYNYQVSLKDPGAFAHGGKYIIQLMYDSIEDLNPELVAGLRRIDHGHFAGSEEAFRHWDEDGAVPGSCSRCHSADGLPLFLGQGVTIAQPVANGFQCATCHNDLSTYTRFEAAEVTFPSGAKVDSGDPNMNLCMTCHQGRSSTVTVNSRIGDKPLDTPDESLGFINIHYFAAGATRFGTEVKGAYEYGGREYVGFFEHVPAADSCTECHNAHQLVVEVETCGNCHEGVATFDDLQSIRESEVDYDGDGDAAEGIYNEVATMREALLVALQDYANNTEGVTPIVYDSHSYPYFFIDTDANGQSDPGEAIFPNRYATWTPRLLQAAYNYQYAAKDPGAFAHNGMYVLQILYDSIQDIGGDVTGMTRP